MSKCSYCKLSCAKTIFDGFGNLALLYMKVAKTAYQIAGYLIVSGIRCMIKGGTCLLNL